MDMACAYVYVCESVGRGVCVIYTFMQRPKGNVALFYHCLPFSLGEGFLTAPGID